MSLRPVPRRPDVALTTLGLGAAQAGNLYRGTLDEGFAAAVDIAWDAGIRYFDTAPHYGLGLSERRLGSALAGRPRSAFTISTKVGRLLVPSPETARSSDLAVGGYDVPASQRRVWDFTRDGVRRSLEGSLDRLGLDRIDIVYLHDPDDHWAEAAGQGVPALVELRDEGVVGAIGAGMNQSAMLTRFVRETDVDIVMCAGRYTLLEQPALDDLLPAAVESSVAVVAAGIYNSGLLAKPFPHAGATYNYFPVSSEILQRAHRIAAVCATHGTTLPEAAVAFASAHPAVVSTVIGVRDARQAEQTVARAAARVPSELWPALQSAGLLRSDAPTPGADASG
jgi:aryl-alcohol dehydrogenase-like predicted oxidoreductase